jgi:hypothetical protein
MRQSATQTQRSPRCGRGSRMEIDMIQHAWLQWWDYEGSAMRPHPSEDTEQFARRITNIAWSNGAFKRLADVENLRAEIAAAIKDRDGLLRALEEIANQDYRGNRSNESLIAQRALAAMRKGVARE